MSSIRITDSKKLVQACVEAVALAVESDWCKNGIGVKKVALLAFGKDDDQREIKAEKGLALAVEQGVLLHYRGRNGGSYRRPDEVAPHNQDEWGGRTGNVKGVIPEKRRQAEARIAELEAQVAALRGDAQVNIG